MTGICLPAFKIFGIEAALETAEATFNCNNPHIE